MYEYSGSNYCNACVPVLLSTELNAINLVSYLNAAFVAQIHSDNMQVFRCLQETILLFMCTCIQAEKVSRPIKVCISLETVKK